MTEDETQVQAIQARKTVIQNYVAFLLENEILTELDTQHDFGLIYQYNYAIKHKDQYGHLAHIFDQIYNYYFFAFSINGFDLACHQRVLEIMIKGTIDHSILSLDRCQMCGEYDYYLSFNEFKPFLALYFEEERDFNPTHNECSFKGEDYQFIIDCPSGELLCTDWVRMKGDVFTHIVEVPENEQYNKYSVNIALGRKLSTQWYADKHNFISVNVGNCSPKVYTYKTKHKEVLKCGKTKTNKSKFKEEAYICTDYWGATIIDKQTLKEIFTKHHPNQVEELMTESLDSVNNNGFVVKVTPGKYNVIVHTLPCDTQRGFRECYFTMELISYVDE